MTGNDVAPNFDQLPILDQAKELCIRATADLKILEVSRHLVRMDRDHVDKALERQELLLEKLNTLAGAGATQPNGEHAKPASVPLCEKCPHDMFVKSSNANFGYCMNLQRFVFESSDCEREGLCTDENASAT